MSSRQRTTYDEGRPDDAVWDAASAIAFAAAERGPVSAAGQEIMDSIAMMVEADFASIITMKPGSDWVVHGRVGEAADNDLLASRYSRYCAEMTGAELRQVARGFQAADNLFPIRRREGLGIFHEFLVPRGLKHVVCAAWVVDTRAWVIGLSRTGPTFPSQSLARLNALVPHLAAAFRALSWQPEGVTGGATVGGECLRVATDGPWALTRAQARVADLAVRGLTNKEIGMLLGTSQNTVRNTLVEVFQKVGVSRRTELAFLMARGAGVAHPRTSVEGVARQQALISLWNEHPSFLQMMRPKHAPFVSWGRRFPAR